MKIEHWSTIAIPDEKKTENFENNAMHLYRFRRANFIRNVHWHWTCPCVCVCSHWMYAAGRKWVLNVDWIGVRGCIDVFTYVYSNVFVNLNDRLCTCLPLRQQWWRESREKYYTKQLAGVYKTSVRFEIVSNSRNSTIIPIWTHGFTGTLNRFIYFFFFG